MEQARDSEPGAEAAPAARGTPGVPAALTAPAAAALARSGLGPSSTAALARSVGRGAPLSNRGVARLLLRDGYGYEFSDDPLNAGGFGPNDATIRVKPGPVRTTLIRRSVSDMLAAILPATGGAIFEMHRVSILESFFGEVLEDLLASVYASEEARAFVKARGLSGLMALGETSPGNGAVDVARATAWLAQQPDRYSPKNRDALTAQRAVFTPPSGTATMTFDDALQEGARVLTPKFGSASGTEHGDDDRDGYDARDWEAHPDREHKFRVVRAKVEPWLAFTGMLLNMGKDVPKSGGGVTQWKADCFEYVMLLRTYAFWRTLTRKEFNARFAPLELGFFGTLGKQLGFRGQTIQASKPGEPPYVWDDTISAGAGSVSMGTKRYLGKTWRQVLDDAPVGAQVIWSNKDAYEKCAKSPGLSFCEAWRSENATKVGRDQYSAHPFGITDEATIVHEMAKAVMGEKIPPGYITKYVYVSIVQTPVGPAPP